MILWHNPRCSKSRETLQLLQDNGHNPDIRLYLKEAPSADEINAVRVALNLPLVQMTRSKDAAFKEAGLANVSEAELLQAMADNSALIERPILINGDKAAIGRPPEAVLAII